MKRNHFLQLIIFCFAILWWGGAAAANLNSQKAQNWVNDKGRQLLETFNEQDMTKKYKTLDEMFLNDVDLEYIGKFVIGKYWRKMTPNEQTQYLDIFKKYVLRVYKTFPLNFNNKINFKVTASECDKKFCNVTTAINIGNETQNQQAQNILVTFRLMENEKKLQLVDLKLAESSLLLSYRNKFYSMLAELDEDIGWFLEDLGNMAVIK